MTSGLPSHGLRLRGLELEAVREDVRGRAYRPVWGRALLLLIFVLLSSSVYGRQVETIYPSENPLQPVDYWLMQEVELKGLNDQWYEAAKWIGGHPGGRTNCHGTTLADGQAWINGASFRRLLEDFFRPVEEVEKGNLIVWFENGRPVYSGIVTSVDEQDFEGSEVEGLFGMETERETTFVWWLNGRFGDQSPMLFEPK